MFACCAIPGDHPGYHRSCLTECASLRKHLSGMNFQTCGGTRLTSVLVVCTPSSLFRMANDKRITAAGGCSRTMTMQRPALDPYPKNYTKREQLDNAILRASRASLEAARAGACQWAPAASTRLPSCGRSGSLASAAAGASAPIRGVPVTSCHLDAASSPASCWRQMTYPRSGAWEDAKD